MKRIPHMVPYAIIQSQVTQSLTEDIGSGDLTAALIPEDKLSTAFLISREKATLCGLQWFNEVFQQLDQAQQKNKNYRPIQINWHSQDGDVIAKDQRVCTLTGNARTILTGERCAMNFLQTLSGTATITARYVKHLSQNSDQTMDKQVKLLDTRKTLPGLREAQKYAVRCGGAYNHRHGLFDGILIKENHIIASGSINNAINTARNNSPHTLQIEVEVETLDEIKEALIAKADILLLDNMSNDMLKQAVALNQQQAKLEVSGNITFERLTELSQLGIDYISSGAITKHLKAVDFSLRFE
jgi:nicotinate-nucleotide pyrophosphorylase (carboxylating)